MCWGCARSRPDADAHVERALRIEDPVLVHAPPVEPQPRVAGDLIKTELLGPLADGLTREDSDPALDRTGSVSCSAVAVMYTPCPLPGATVESNTTMAICGRTAMFCEWRAPGWDTQYSSG
jgi:hypothetical protein